MSAGNYTIDVEQGATFNRTITWTDQNGDPNDLTGYTATLTVRKAIGTDVILLLTIGDGLEIPNPLDGKILMEITDTKTSALPYNSYKYQLKITNGTESRRLIEGAFNVDAQI